MSSGNPIPLRVSNKQASVWDIDDIAKLRSHHHICGVLAGTLPHLSQQNVFLGVPLLLMPEEVVLLVEKKLAVLVDDTNAHRDPTPTALSRWDSERLRGVERQLALAEEHDAKEALNPDRAMSEKAIRKRKEREEKRAHGKSTTTDTSQEIPEEDPSLFAPTNHDLPGFDSHPKSSGAPSSHTSGVTAPPQTSTLPYTIQVPGASSTFEWYDHSAHSFATLAAAREAGVWDYPTTPAERARCGVFQDLWEQGYFMGGGIKFGGEYLVYPGDPLRYHSHFVANVIESPEAALRPMEIIAHGRLGTGTKKSHLLCEWDDDKKSVTYYSIEWAGFG
ncbi:tRNA-intron endonuclease catalytic domain-like protein [Melanogaster broomeanus]|nr:tRNA-intron endonuclease catalytic domain-like protein [Melanogaster broomeanus]